MKLLTRALKKRFAEVGNQEVIHDPLVIAKFFNPAGAGTWYATEYLPEGGLFFGFVSIFGDHNDEWGYFGLTELTDISGNLGLGIERDKFFREKRMSLLIPKVLVGKVCVSPGCLFRACYGDYCDRHKEI